MKFSENLNLPILQDGDKYSKEIQNEAFNTIDKECTNINNTIKSILDINDDVTDAIKTLGDISEELSDLKEKQNEDYYELLESNNYIGEKIKDINSQLNNIVYNPLNFGAKENDNTIDLANVINSMFSDEKINNILVSDGKYSIKSTIIVPSYKKLEFSKKAEISLDKNVNGVQLKNGSRLKGLKGSVGVDDFTKSFIYLDCVDNVGDVLISDINLYNKNKTGSAIKFNGDTGVESNYISFVTTDKVSINGFEKQIELKCLNENSWVNSNSFSNFISNDCPYPIWLEGLANTEHKYSSVDSNIFTNTHIQTTTNTIICFNLIGGCRNVFDGVIWDLGVGKYAFSFENSYNNRVNISDLIQLIQGDRLKGNTLKENILSNGGVVGCNIIPGYDDLAIGSTNLPFANGYINTITTSNIYAQKGIKLDLNSAGGISLQKGNTIFNIVSLDNEEIQFNKTVSGVAKAGIRYLDNSISPINGISTNLGEWGNRYNVVYAKEINLESASGERYTVKVRDNGELYTEQ